MISVSKRNKKAFQYIFLAFLMGLTAYIVTSTLDIKLIPKIIKIIDYRYIVLGMSLILMYIVLEGHIIRIIINSIHKTNEKLIGTKTAMMGLYYNLVTPMASGSQPMQIYALSKSNMPVSKAMAVVVNKTVVFQLIVTIYCGILAFINQVTLRSELKSVYLLIITGITMNIIMIGLGFFIVYNPNKTKKIVNIIIKFSKKFKLLKFIEKRELEINKFIDEYNYSINLFIKDKKSLIVSLILTIVQLTIYFSVTFCIYKALRFSGETYITLLTLQVFLYMAVSPIPTPGNVGANEIAFFTIFSSVFPKEIIGYSVFLYGMIMYYFILVVCGLCTIVFHYKMDKKSNKYYNA